MDMSRKMRSLHREQAIVMIKDLLAATPHMTSPYHSMTQYFMHCYLTGDHNPEDLNLDMDRKAAMSIIRTAMEELEAANIIGIHRNAKRTSATWIFGQKTKHDPVSVRFYDLDEAERIVREGLEAIAPGTPKGLSTWLDKVKPGNIVLRMRANIRQLLATEGDSAGTKRRRQVMTDNTIEDLLITVDAVRREVESGELATPWTPQPIIPVAASVTEVPTKPAIEYLSRSEGVNYQVLANHLLVEVSAILNRPDNNGLMAHNQRLTEQLATITARYEDVCDELETTKTNLASVASAAREANRYAIGELMSDESRKNLERLMQEVPKG